MASGLAGVGRAAGASAVAPISRAASRAARSLQESFAAGARSGFTATGGASTMGAASGDIAGGGGATTGTDSGVPAWAERMKRDQTLFRGAETAGHALRSGDSHGGGHSIDLSEGE